MGFEIAAGTVNVCDGLLADGAPFMVPTIHAGQPLRLAFCNRAPARGGIDGAWWPTSAQLGPELPDLISIFTSRIGPVRRVVYDPTAWSATPSRVILRGVPVSIDPYSMVAAETVYLLGTHARTALLYAIPPTSEAGLVRRILGTVSQATGDEINVAVLRNLLDGVAT